MHSTDRIINSLMYATFLVEVSGITVYCSYLLLHQVEAGPSVSESAFNIIAYGGVNGIVKFHLASIKLWTQFILKVD